MHRFRAPPRQSTRLAVVGRSALRVAAAWGVVVLAACATTSAPVEVPVSEADAKLGPTVVASLVRIVALESARAPASEISAFIHDESPRVRARAALALARLEHRDALSPLSSLVRDGDDGVRAAAAFGLGQLDLALDDKVAGHVDDRASAEQALLNALEVERSDDVRASILRALGRLSMSTGLDALIARASSSSPGQAVALEALGVSGARRQASRSRDDRLLVAVRGGLRSSAPDVQTAAAYAAFRQKLALDVDDVEAMRTAPEQARIFVARCLASAQEPALARGLQLLGADADWRVRVEVARVIGARSVQTDALEPLASSAVQGLIAGRAAEGHVLREACAAAAKAAPPAFATTLRALLAAIPATPQTLSVRCACAVAVDVIDPQQRATETCTEGVEKVHAAPYFVARIAQARTSSVDRAAALRAYIDDAAVPVRMAAAQALVDDASDAAAEIGATRLLTEGDPGVASTLLQLFADGAHADIVRDTTLLGVVDRFREARTPEGRDPLLAVASIVPQRAGQLVDELRARLALVKDPRIDDALAHVAAGDRMPGPRAVVPAPKAPGLLPLVAVLRTTRGTIRIAFERELAPIAVDNFVSLARKGAYDGTAWHRVVADFVAQGGDPRGDGSGGPGYTIPCENSEAQYVRGAVGMAHAGKDTAGSQFFLTHSWQPHLDGRYTLFAHVVDGLDVMDALQPDDVLTSVEITTALNPHR